MDIQRLLVVLTEQDLNDLAAKHLPKDLGVESLEISIEPEGVRVKGSYQMFMPVSFEILWELGVDGGIATARLANFRTLGMPANVLKSLIMNVIADAGKKHSWLQVVGDVVRVDGDGLLKKEGLTARANLRALRCQAGKLVVEAGN
ncbi:MAG TPA: hypothetical protein VE988_06700 [Gemmataceae bacterium]|nr:hypothetical protein [Gemmataceae bacterium]